MAIVELGGQQGQSNTNICDNCGRTIGALEQPYQWNMHVVCPTCLPLLQANHQPADAWYVSDGGTQTGPHCYAELAAALMQRRIPTNAMVWQEGWSSWESADQHFSMPADPNEGICRIEGVMVTARSVTDRNGRLPIDHISSVKAEPGFFSGYVVSVFDFAGRASKFRFGNANNANRFIAAVRRLNPAITIDKDEAMWFIIWEF